MIWRWCADCDNNSSGPLPQRSSAKAQPSPGTKADPAPDYSGMQMDVIEGIAREMTVLSRSRSRELRMLALERACGVCEACCVDFSSLLSGLGARALQVHHRHQLALQDEPVFNRVADVAVVCANCHAMIHADPVNALSVEQLRSMLLDRTEPVRK